MNYKKRAHQKHQYESTAKSANSQYSNIRSIVSPLTLHIQQKSTNVIPCLTRLSIVKKFSSHVS